MTAGLDGEFDSTGQRWEIGDEGCACSLIVGKENCVLGIIPNKTGENTATIGYPHVLMGVIFLFLGKFPD